MSKRIGIVGWSQGEQSFGVLKSYLEYAKTYSDNIIVLTPNTRIELDLLILPGGKDVINGGGGDYSFWNSDGERFLEHFDANTLPWYIEQRTPIYGICRGMQTLVRHFGGALTQNLCAQHGYSKDNEDSKGHLLNFTQSYNHLAKATRTTTIGSWHHQGIIMDQMPDCLETIAFNAQDGCVEFFKHKTLPIVGEQSHPERNNNSLERLLIKQLLNED